jgi:hypothetical protein
VFEKQASQLAMVNTTDSHSETATFSYIRELYAACVDNNCAGNEKKDLCTETQIYMKFSE